MDLSPMWQLRRDRQDIIEITAHPVAFSECRESFKDHPILLTRHVPQQKPRVCYCSGAADRQTNRNLVASREHWIGTAVTDRGEGTIG